MSRYQLQAPQQDLGLVRVGGSGRVGSFGSRIGFGGRGFRSFGNFISPWGFPFWNQWYQPWYPQAVSYTSAITAEDCLREGGQIVNQNYGNYSSLACQTRVKGADGVERIVTKPLVNTGSYGYSPYSYGYGMPLSPVVIY